MAKPRTDPEIGNGRGVTLIELTVAMFIAGTVLAMTLLSWTYISRHTTMQQRKSIFASQAEQTASLIANDIRKSPGIISIDAHAIAYLSPEGGDTVRYYFDNDSLRKNNAAVLPVAQCSKIVQFTIAKQDSAMTGGLSYSAQDKQQDIILLMTFGMQDCFNNQSVVRLAVKVKLLAGGPLLSGSRTWNW